MIFKIFLFSMLTASLSYFLTRSELLFEFRIWIVKKSKLLANLFDCGYCMSHWVAGAIVISFNFRLFGIAWPADCLLTIFVIAWLAALQIAIFEAIWRNK